MKILFVGRSECGKTLAGEYAATLLKTKCTNISDLLVAEFAEKMGVSPDVIMKNKEEYRKPLWELGRSYQESSPASLALKALEAGDVVTGVRNKDEFEACRGLFDKVVWVSRFSAQAKIGDVLTPEDADVILDNNGSKNDLYMAVMDLMGVTAVEL